MRPPRPPNLPRACACPCLTTSPLQAHAITHNPLCTRVPGASDWPWHPLRPPCRRRQPARARMPLFWPCPPTRPTRNALHLALARVPQPVHLLSTPNTRAVPCRWSVCLCGAWDSLSAPRPLAWRPWARAHRFVFASGDPPHSLRLPSPGIWARAPCSPSHPLRCKGAGSSKTLSELRGCGRSGPAGARARAA